MNRGADGVKQKKVSGTINRLLAGSTGVVNPTGALYLIADTNWAWTTTGSQSSTLAEENGVTRAFAMLPGSNPFYTTTVDHYNRTTAATELNSSASVVRTSTSGGPTGSTAGSYAVVGRGIADSALPLVPVGTDGMQFALGGAPLSNSMSMMMSTSDLFSAPSPTGPVNWGTYGNTSLSSQFNTPTPAGTPSTNHRNAPVNNTGYTTGNTAYQNGPARSGGGGGSGLGRR